jgi:hypothetical protein
LIGAYSASWHGRFRHFAIHQVGYSPYLSQQVRRREGLAVPELSWQVELGGQREFVQEAWQPSALRLGRLAWEGRQLRQRDWPKSEASGERPVEQGLRVWW